MAKPKRKRLAVRIDLESAALADGFGDLELGAILRLLGDRIGAGALSDGINALAVGHAMPVRDSNGVIVGMAEVRMS